MKLINMFNDISKNYDLINSILSLGMDFNWRKKLVDLLKKKILSQNNYINILDLATGTGELAFLLSKKFYRSNIIGLDPANKMLKIAKKKLYKKKIKNISFINGNSCNIPFNDEYFDIITISFGIRNFQHIHVSMKEIYRVLNPYGLLAILEFSIPSNIFIKKIYYYYNKIIVNTIGKLLSNNNYAYKYLCKSINSFYYYGNKMKKLLMYHNFNEISIKKLLFEIVSIYISNKKCIY
ncbi:bifunctional demethylmenaquinone methyltransferase/2-methoxy-6-polyprenyl-1,4-benzoquinol methylase UbiE [Blattabacterium cuenoti]|uniref:bifunctional demethylmenaquinone methyltransferase/2-methoxy-6-polyprenyl-1,4-benzoquinol methylase UbiE n=1 Tax=Blattabacterium cuenoti TaxID=1653831 RepID=UPI00163D215A|nr:bifunctional demethylmenaquinone methyltransferase/2-methoxy-6-polyprenyl-1,4-benzoquinol methylase UbiE [Blattabacterium cuenoti]